MTIAPKILAVAMSKTRSIIAVKIVPRIPTSNADIAEHTQPDEFSPLTKGAVIRATARYTAAVPKAAYNNVVVKAIVAVVVKNAVITPIIMLAITAITVQLHLKLQLQLVLHIINSPPIIIYELLFMVVNFYSCYIVFTIHRKYGIIIISIFVRKG